MLLPVLRALSLAVLLATPALAQDATDTLQPPPPCQRAGKTLSDADMQPARKILTMNKVADRMQQVMDAASSAMIDVIRKGKPDMPESMLTEFKNELHTEVAAEIPNLMDIEACLYVQHYTADELAQLAEFYQTPLGQKVLVTSPTLLKESFAVGQAWGRQVGARAVQRVLARHKQDGDKT